MIFSCLNATVCVLACLWKFRVWQTVTDISVIPYIQNEEAI